MCARARVSLCACVWCVCAWEGVGQCTEAEGTSKVTAGLCAVATEGSCGLKALGIPTFSWSFAAEIRPLKPLGGTSLALSALKSLPFL